MKKRVDKSTRRMASRHYVKDAFFFLSDLHINLVMNPVEMFSKSDAVYAKRLIEELDEMKGYLHNLADSIETKKQETVDSFDGA